DARLKVTGLTAYDLDADLKAKLNLAELTQAFPVEGISLRGLFNVDVKAKGKYDAAQKLMPSVTAMADMIDGYVKSADFPAPLEKINFSAKADNPTGQMKDTKVHVENFSMMLEGEPFTMNAYVENFDDYTYDFKVKGNIDLAKITKIYPVEGSAISGLMKADIAAKGKMSDVTAGRYDRLPTSGNMSLAAFTYASKDLAQPVKINYAALTFDPQKITINQFEGALGKSAITATGSMSNYIAWFLSGKTLKGTMSMSSPLFDTNEWLSDMPPPANGTPPAETPMEVIAVPNNIDMVMNAKMDKVLYTNMVLENMTGSIIVRDGQVRMERLNFNTLDGSIGVSGNYDPRVMTRPLFDFDLSMQNVNVKKAYETFGAIQKLAPVAKSVEGAFSTKFALNGPLTQQMMPDYAGLNGGGNISLNGASLKNLEMIAGLNKVAHTSFPTDVNLKDVVVKTTIKNGRAEFAPFTIGAGANQVTLSGSNGFDGTIDWLAKLNIPAGAAGAAINDALAKLSGQAATGSKNIKANVKVTGTTTSPKYALAGVETGAGGTGTSVGNSLKAGAAAAKEQIQQQVDKAKDEAAARLKAEQDRLKKEAEDRAKAEQERLKQEAKDKAEDAVKKAKKKFGF
ncbi:MAG: AsmA-like C-terminal region-containing protein, partial [Bacteroidota bacterium]